MVRLVYDGDARGCGAQARVSRVSDALEGQQPHVGVDRRVNAARNRCMSRSDLLVTDQEVKRSTSGYTRAQIPESEQVRRHEPVSATAFWSHTRRKASNRLGGALHDSQALSGPS